MSIKDRRSREKEELKQKILESAFRIVNQMGYHALTIRKLAEEIEYSPRTIYLYYADKEDLLRAIVEYGFSFTVKNLEANDFYKDLSPEEHLKAAIGNHLKMAFENINYYNTVIHVIQSSGYEPGPNQKKVEAYLKESLVPHLSIDGVTPEFSLFFLFSSLRGVTVELINRESSSKHEDLSKHRDMIFNLYKNILRK